MKWAFSDESRRGGTYVVAAVVVETHGVTGARAEVRGFLRGNQRRVHMAKESAARRNQFLALVERVVPAAFVVEAAVRSDPLAEVRTRAMRALTRSLVDERVAMWHIERMVPAIEARDRHVIREVLDAASETTPMSYDHRLAHDEPLLWAADAVAWAASRRTVEWATTTRLP